MTLGSLWHYYRDEVNVDANEIDDRNHNKINSTKTIKIKSFKYKTKLIESTSNDNNT